MVILLAMASGAILIVLMWDMFITVFSGNGAGPLSKLWYALVWWGLLAIHAHLPIHRTLSLAGPFMLLASFLLWYLMLAVALFLILAAFPGSVLNSSTGQSANLLEVAYFVSTTISSLGYGDQVPAGFPWTLASTISTLGGAVIITVSLSYVLAVLAASIERRKLAQGIFGIGGTTAEIIEHARLHDPQQSLKVHILSLTSEIDNQGLKHLAYPILRYFHSPRADLSPDRAILLLSDTFFLLSVLSEGRRPPVGLRHIVSSSIGRYVELRHSNPISQTASSSETAHLIETARDLGSAIEEGDCFDVALKEYLPRRNLLVDICRQDGWDVK